MTAQIISLCEYRAARNARSSPIELPIAMARAGIALQIYLLQLALDQMRGLE